MDCDRPYNVLDKHVKKRVLSVSRDRRDTHQEQAPFMSSVQLSLLRRKEHVMNGKTAISKH